MAEIRNEHDVKREVRKLLTKYGWYTWMPPANGYGKGGISDFHALKDGKFLAIETKYGGNTTTTLQAKFMASIAAAGGYAVVVNEMTLDTFEFLLGQI